MPVSTIAKPGKIDIHTLKVTYYPLPVHGHPYSVRVDAAHSVWTDVPMADAILKFDPKTEQFEDADANKFLTRDYRAGSEVPKLA